MISQARTALVHEWLTDWGGSEDVTRLMLESLPQAQLHATIDFLSEEHRARLGGGPIQTTFLQRAPFVQKKFWNYLPLTGLGVVNRIITDLAVLDVTPAGLKVVEMAPGVTREELQSKTGVPLK